MKSWLTASVAAVTIVLMVGSVALAGGPKATGPPGVPAVTGDSPTTGPRRAAEGSQSTERITRSHSAGAVTIDVSWLMPRDVPTAETLTFEVRMNTHSVDLDQYDMARLSRLETSRGPSIEPLGWFDPGGGGHHLYGLLKFSATRPDGSPILHPETSFIEVVIQEVGDIPERRFRWELPPTKMEAIGPKPNGV